MAYLNVRERLIEAKIAYVGPELSGKRANFEHLCKSSRNGRATTLAQESLEGGHLLSFEWRPQHLAKFNDCDVLVRLMATHGVVSARALERVLRDADGLVVVVDSDPNAQERNRRSIESLKQVLARAETDSMPVVVQLNKRDLPNAIPPDQIILALNTKWPHVPASAARGEGVVETLEKALSNVIDSVKRSPTEAEAPAPKNGVQTEGNPLLAALRQILRDSIAERIGTIEERIAHRFEARFAALASELAALRQKFTQDGEKARTAATNDATLLAKKIAQEFEAALQRLTKEAEKTRKSSANELAEIAAKLAAEGEKTREAVTALSEKIDAIENARKNKKSWFT